MIIPTAIQLLSFLGVVPPEPATTQVHINDITPKIYVDPSSEVIAYNAALASCGTKYKPDSPLRAYVGMDGEIVAIAGHIINYSMHGKSPAYLKIKCKPILSSAEVEDPSKFSDREWIASTWTSDGRDVMALVHDEYQAYRFKNRCNYKEYMLCWYNTITNYRSTDGGASFTKRKPLFAIGPYLRFSGSVGKHIGFYNPSNIIKQGDFLYTFVFTNGFSKQTAGVCLFRSFIGDRTKWYGWRSGKFDVIMADPYSKINLDRNCEVLKNLESVVGSVVWNEESHLFFAATSSTSPVDGSVRISYSSSVDMLNWLKTKTLIDVPTMWSKDCNDKFRYGYPSMISKTPLDRNFSVTGPNGYLFMTRFHVKDCKLSEVRDLVRLKYRIVM
jgi:hypothetical protein